MQSIRNDRNVVNPLIMSSLIYASLSFSRNSSPMNCCWKISRKWGFSPNFEYSAWVRPVRWASFVISPSSRFSSIMSRSKNSYFFRLKVPWVFIGFSYAVNVFDKAILWGGFSHTIQPDHCLISMNLWKKRLLCFYWVFWGFVGGVVFFKNFAILALGISGYIEQISKTVNGI